MEIRKSSVASPLVANRCQLSPDATSRMFGREPDGSHSLRVIHGVVEYTATASATRSSGSSST